MTDPAIDPLAPIDVPAVADVPQPAAVASEAPKPAAPITAVPATAADPLVPTATTPSIAVANPAADAAPEVIEDGEHAAVDHSYIWLEDKTVQAIDSELGATRENGLLAELAQYTTDEQVARVRAVVDAGTLTLDQLRTLVHSARQQWAQDQLAS